MEVAWFPAVPAAAAIYAEDNAFLGRFLLAFEDILSGAPGGYEEI